MNHNIKSIWDYETNKKLQTVTIVYDKSDEHKFIGGKEKIIELRPRSVQNFIEGLLEY